MYAINWASKAKKQLRKIDQKEQGTIVDAVDGLAQFPKTPNVVALTKHEYGYRLRVGHYRVLFDADTKIKIIDVRQVKKRDDQTY